MLTTVVVLACVAFGANAQWSPYSRNWQNVFMNPMMTGMMMDDMTMMTTPTTMMMEDMMTMDTMMNPIMMKTGMGMGMGMWGQKKCAHSNKCINKVEEITDITATKVCDASTYGKWQEMKHCCKAGAMVGRTVGQRWKQTCLPATIKFEHKTAQCTEKWNQCKHAFMSCCQKQTWWKEPETMMMSTMNPTTMMMSPMTNMMTMTTMDQPEMMMAEEMMEERAMLPW